MPKQQLNITDFTGGLNCYSDARDIQENQFAQNWNASLDKYGVIRYTGAGTKHIINHPHTNTNFIPGGGLFSFGYDFMPNTLVDSGNFSISHEEGTTNCYNEADATEVLNNTGDFSSNWTRTGDFAIDSTDASYTHSSGAGTIYQTSFSHTPTVTSMHVLVFTISGTPGGTLTSLKLKGGSGYFADEDITLPKTDGTHTVYFKAYSTITRFEISAVSSGTCTFNIDDISVKQTNLAMKLATSPTKISATSHETDDYYNNMLISVIDGAGKGQTRKITDYDGTTKIATLGGAFGLSDSSGSIASIDGTGIDIKAVALLRVYNFGTDGSEPLEQDHLFLETQTSAGVSQFILIRFKNSTVSTRMISSLSDAEAVNNSVVTNFETYGPHGYAQINKKNKTAAQVAASIVSVINDIDDISDTYAASFTAAAVSDGSADTIVKITDETSGANIDRQIRMLPTPTTLYNPTISIDIFQPFQQYWGGGEHDSGSNQIAKCASTGHSLNVGEYVTISEVDAEYSKTFEVLWVETNYFYIKSDAGDPSTDGAGTFTSIPNSSSGYVIHNIKSDGASNWNINGINDAYGSRLVSNKALNTDVARVHKLPTPGASRFLSSSVEVTTANTSGDLGYLEIPAQRLYPGTSYTLEFEMLILNPWQMFVANGANADILPGALIYSPTAGDGTKAGVLMDDNLWVESDEPVEGNELSPFTNKIDNGDFTDITDTSMHVNGAVSASTSGRTVVVQTENATDANSLNNIFTTSTGLPVGLCTEVTDTTHIAMERIEVDLDDNAELHTLDGWKIKGGKIIPILLKNTLMETNDMLSGTATSKTLESYPGIEKSDGGPDGGNVLLLRTGEQLDGTDYLYQDIELDGNCHYHLYFKFATTVHDNTMGQLKYDIKDKEREVSLTNSWQVTDTGGNGYLNRWNEAEPESQRMNRTQCYYSHVNQETTTVGGNRFVFEYVKFFVPPLETETDSVRVRFKFAPADIYSGNTVGISAVSVKKAFPDLVTMVNQQNTGHLPVRYDDGFDWDNPDYRKGNSGYSYITGPIIYKLNFTVPSEYKEKSDWVIRLYGGKFGYTTGSATATTHHSRYSQNQSVGFSKINLIADIAGGESLDKNILLLNDNTSSNSKIYAYYEEYGHWDTDFLSFGYTNADPFYIYVNGMLQISDANLNNTSELFYHFYIDRTSGHTHEKGFKTTNNVIKFIDACTTSNLGSETVSHGEKTIPLADIHKDLWEDHAMVPKYHDQVQGLQYYASDTVTPSTYYGSGWKTWHYKYFDYWQAATTDYVDGLYITAQMIPVKSVWPMGYPGTGQGYHWNEISDSGRTVFSTENLSNLNSEIDSSSFSGNDSKLRFPGGSASKHNKNAGTGGSSQYSYGQSEGNGTNDKYGAGTWHTVNNPVYLPISGNDLGSGKATMTSELIAGGYEDAINNPLELKQVKVRIYAFMTGVNILRNSVNGNVTAEYPLKNRYMPRVRARLYKTYANLSDVNSIKTLFTDNANGTLVSIPECTWITRPHNSRTFAQHGDGNTVDEVTLSYDEEWGGGDMQWSNGVKFGWYHKQWAWYTWNIPEGSGVTNLTNLVIKLEITNPSTTNTDDFLAFCGVNPRANGGYSGAAMPGREQQFGYLLDAYNPSGSSFNAKFYPLEFEVDAEASNTDLNSIHVNLDFIDSAEQEVNDETGQVETVEGIGWALRVFSLATSTVNLFGEESPLEVSEGFIGDVDLILTGQLPVMDILVGQDLINNTLIKEVKIYMKDTSEDTWYLQASISTETLEAKSSTSGTPYHYSEGSESSAYRWTIHSSDLTTFNEVDSYESETLVKQKDAEILPTLTCNYKVGIHVNNRLYVGNIKQNGKTYGDRMLKTPVGKYNIFPASNYIDVAIHDGDEITGLAYYKDRILQFKKRKVFAINVSGDYEYLEDTFSNVGVNKQCQITETPYGIAWVNASGCFLYDGKKVSNLIDNKVGTESFQSNPLGSTNNFWTIVGTDIPAIGYVKSTKKLIIARNTGPATPGGDTSELVGTSVCEGFQYDFQSQGWTFLSKKLTATPETASIVSQGYLSNFTNNKDGDIVYYAVDAPSDTFDGINAIYKWTDDSTTSSNSDGLGDNFILRTKDFDFGSPGVRKKIYKVYVTFKSTNDGSAAHSNIKVYYATNGSETFTEFSNDSTNYSTTNGLSDGASSTGWITAELKPSSSINNIYSFAIKFEGGGTNIADDFEINDYTIVYRIKNVK